MQVIKPKYEIVNEPDWDQVLINLEKAIRTCYKSEKKIDAGTAHKLIRSIIERGHESTLEHASITVRFTCDRGVSHEIVRHRHCSFSQESTRYVNYSGEMQFILPPWIPDTVLGDWSLDRLMTAIPLELSGAYEWLSACILSEKCYRNLINTNWKPEQARSVLPNSLKTEIVVTTNMRDWRHLLSLRCDEAAHPQMRELMIPLREELREKCPTLFCE